MLKASQLDPYAFIPDANVLQQKRRRMVMLVTAVLVDNFDFLFELRSKIVRRIPHKYSEEMEQRSEVVSASFEVNGASEVRKLSQNHKLYMYAAY